MAKKYFEYSAIIQSHLMEMFESESRFHIDQMELVDGENMKAFLHALATVVPCQLYNEATKEETNHLEFNHIANHLVFEFAEKEVNNG